MDKKKIIIPIIIVILLILIGVGVLSFIKFNKEDNKSNTSNNSSQEIEEAAGMNSEYSSKEDVMNEIQNNIKEANVTVQFIKEEDDCWYYKDTLNREYFYCEANPIIIEVEEDQTKK